MKVVFATEYKAIEASTKHFGGKFDSKQMNQLAAKIIMNAEYVGVSDRANKGHTTARIIWSTIDGVMFAVILDGNDLKNNKATVVSMYDVHNVEVKAKRFNMKKVK